MDILVAPGSPAAPLVAGMVSMETPVDDVTAAVPPVTTVLTPTDTSPVTTMLTPTDTSPPAFLGSTESPDAGAPGYADVSKSDDSADADAAEAVVVLEEQESSEGAGSGSGAGAVDGSTGGDGFSGHEFRIESPREGSLPEVYRWPLTALVSFATARLNLIGQARILSTTPFPPQHTHTAFFILVLLTMTYIMKTLQDTHSTLLFCMSRDMIFAVRS